MRMSNLCVWNVALFYSILLIKLFHGEVRSSYKKKPQWKESVLMLWLLKTIKCDLWS